jgi:predicted RNA-binding protein with PUA-like domain
MPTKKHWLLKSEPDCFSIDDLAAAPAQTTCWDGVRNYQARNFMRDDMKTGDQVLYYHSNAKPPHLAGTSTVVRESYPDHTCWDKNNDHYDPKSTQLEPRWFMVDIQLAEKFAETLSLEELRSIEALADMVLLQKGSRLSVQPVKKKEFDTIVKLAKKKAKQTRS